MATSGKHSFAALNRALRASHQTRHPSGQNHDEEPTREQLLESVNEAAKNCRNAVGNRHGCDQ